MEMKLKMDDDGHVVVSGDGLPVYEIDGKDTPIDVPNLYAKVPELNTEAAKYRKQRNEMRETLKIFEGIDDIPEWKANADKAIETVQNFKDKDLVEAGKVEEIKSAMQTAHKEELDNVKASFEGQIGKLEGKLGEQESTIYHLMVSQQFSQSPYFVGSDTNPPKTILTPEIAEAYFGKQFKVEMTDDGRRVVVGYDTSGNQLYSRARPGELADFGEALEQIINVYPQKDQIMRAGKSGSGAVGGGDDKTPAGEIAKLEAAYKAAQEAGDGKACIAIKNQLHDARMKLRNKAA